MKQKAILTFYYENNDGPVKLRLDQTRPVQIYLQSLILQPYLEQAGFKTEQKFISNNMVYICEENSIEHFWLIFPADEKKYCDFCFRML